MNPSGPGAFPFSIWKAASSTSSVSIALINSVLCSGVTSLGMWHVMVIVAYTLSSSDSLSRSAKKVTSSCSISFWDSSIFSSVDFKWEIQLCYLCWIVDLWKNLVFRSPSQSHSLQDFYCHRISSCFSLCISSWMMTFSAFLSSFE